MAAALACENVGHTYGAGELAETVLRDVSVSFSSGETCVLMGPSGSGKTTLLSILGCLLTPSAGRLWIGDELVVRHSRRQLMRLRRDRLGFVFQYAQLLPFLTVDENLVVVGRNAGLTSQTLARRIPEVLERLGLSDCRQKKPDQLSGGQRQRVAIARAVLHRPSVILTDEPTAALDWEHGREAIRLLIDQAKQEGAMLLAVTHDARLLPFFGRRIGIDRGRLVEDRA